MKNKIFLLPLTTMIISGLSVYLNAQLVKGVDPILQTTIKNSLVGTMIIISLFISGKINQLRKFKPSQWLQLLIIAMVGGSLSFGLFFTGLKHAGAVEGALIHKSMVVWIALLAPLFLKEKLSPLMLFGAISLYAVNFIGGARFASFNHFQLLVLAATLLWSLEAIIAKKYLSHLDPDILLFGRMGLGSGLLVAYTAFTDRLSLISQITTTQWQGIIIISFLLFGYVTTWYRSLKHLSPVLVSSILVGATVITTILNSLNTGVTTFTQVIQSLAIIGVVSFIYFFSTLKLGEPIIQHNRAV